MSKDQFSAFFLPFLVKSGLFGVNPDHFLTNFFKKGRMQTKSEKKVLDYILKIDISIIFRNFPR